MQCSVFIATSLDGFIATPDGGVAWLDQAGNSNVDMGNEDMGFSALMESVDCLIMGRRCMEVVASFNLTDEQWPYGDTRIITLSNSLIEVPDSLKGRVELMSGSVSDLMDTLTAQGHKHAYVDGGALISSFINLKLITHMTITKAPVILGEGIPLFQNIQHPVKFKNAHVQAYANDFIQERYEVNYE